MKTFAYSPKEGNVTATIGPYFYKTHYSSSGSGARAPYMGGLGIIANGDISSRGALEIGVFHMNKLFIREEGPLVIGEETELMHITMGYRRWISPLYSASLTFFSSYSMGDYRQVHNDFPAGMTPDTSARDTTEYGFDFSLQAELWQKDRLGLIADVRYSLSVTQKPGEKADHYGFMLGLRYFIQEKQIIDNPKTPK